MCGPWTSFQFKLVTISPVLVELSPQLINAVKLVAALLNTPLVNVARSWFVTGVRAAAVKLLAWAAIGVSPKTKVYFC